MAVRAEDLRGPSGRGTATNGVDKVVPIRRPDQSASSATVWTPPSFDESHNERVPDKDLVNMVRERMEQTDVHLAPIEHFLKGSSVRIPGCLTEEEIASRHETWRGRVFTIADLHGLSPEQRHRLIPFLFTPVGSYEDRRPEERKTREDVQAVREYERTEKTAIGAVNIIDYKQLKALERLGLKLFLEPTVLTPEGFVTPFWKIMILKVNKESGEKEVVADRDLLEGLELYPEPAMFYSLEEGGEDYRVLTVNKDLLDCLARRSETIAEMVEASR